ncbi:hypothetical protein QQP08_016350 [Theobroma cacao]|nr:hypothetical protein QQP08_016350 [Theobroma cacao]
MSTTKCPGLDRKQVQTYLCKQVLSGFTKKLSYNFTFFIACQRLSPCLDNMEVLFTALKGKKETVTMKRCFGNSMNSLFSSLLSPNLHIVQALA